MTPFEIANQTFVILMKDASGHVTLLADPGMDRPWRSTNKRLADFHAKECDGEAHTWQEAFDILLKEYPGLEQELVARIARKTQDVTKMVLDANSAAKGINVNNHPTPSDGTILGASGQPLT